MLRLDLGMKDLKIRGVIRKSYKTQGKQICSMFFQGLIRKMTIHLLPPVQGRTGTGDWGGRGSGEGAATWGPTPGVEGAGRTREGGKLVGLLTLDGIHREDGLRRRAWQQAAVQWRWQLSGD
jgi:hypothetical protein